MLEAPIYLATRRTAGLFSMHMTIRSVVRSSCLVVPGILALALANPARGQVTDVPAAEEDLGSIQRFGTGSPASGSSPEATLPADFEPAKVLAKTPVAYPTLADLNRIEGLVTIRFYIDESGHVRRVAVAKSANPLLNQLAGDPRLLQWTFTPAKFKGRLVPSTHDQEFEFRLDPEQQKRIAIHRMALAIGTPDPPYPPLAIPHHLQGNVTISVKWTKEGLVGEISLVKSSGSSFLDSSALRFAYENWRIDPAAASPDQPFVKTIKFVAPPK
jgi:TonB family protein